MYRCATARRCCLAHDDRRLVDAAQLVVLGPLAAEPVTLRAAWSAKGNSRQHLVETLVDRFGVPPGGVRDLQWTTCAS